MRSLLRECNSLYADGTLKIVPDHFLQLYTLHVEKDGFVFPCVYALMTSKSEENYLRLFRKLLEFEPAFNPAAIMVDFEKAVINAFEEIFIAVVPGCFFHLSQNVYRKIQSEGLVTQYNNDREFATWIKMLPSLAFVPENEVTDCFNLLMQNFPESAINVATYFETNYIGKKLADQTRRTPIYPIRIWNMYGRMNLRLSRTNNSVEGWHNAMKSSFSSLHPSLCKFLKYIQREQAFQEAKLIKWEAGDVPTRLKESIARDERLLHLVTDYVNRDPLTYLRGISYNFEF